MEFKQKEEIEFEDLTKLDIRICEVIGAERVQKTDKLIKLEIDTGIDVRTCVTNLGEKYESEDFLGKRLPFVINLKPMVIKKIETKAMIFCFEYEGRIDLESSNMPIGSKFL